jgi:hypothetical protein
MTTADVSVVVDAPDAATARNGPTTPQRHTSCTTAITECAASKFWTFGGLFLVLIIITSTNLGLDAGKIATINNNNLTEVALQQLLLDDKQVSSRFKSLLRGQLERVASVVLQRSASSNDVPDNNTSLPRVDIPLPVSEPDHRELSEG